MFKHGHRRRLPSCCWLGSLPRPPAQAQDIEILLALPAPTLTFSSAFLAEDAGFYKKEGLKVSTPHPGRRGLAQCGDRGQRGFHHRHRPGVPARGGGGPADARHRQPDRQAAGRAGAAQGRRRCRRHHRQDAAGRARQGAEGQDHRDPGCRLHRPCLGAPRGQPRRPRHREGRSHRADGPAGHAGGDGNQADRRLRHVAALHHGAVVKGKAVMLASGTVRCSRSAAVRLRADLHASDMCTKAAREMRACCPTRSPLPTGSSSRSRTRRWTLLKKRFDKMDQQVLAAAWKTVSRPRMRKDRCLACSAIPKVARANFARQAQPMAEDEFAA